MTKMHVSSKAVWKKFLSLRRLPPEADKLRGDLAFALGWYSQWSQILFSGLLLQETNMFAPDFDLTVPPGKLSLCR